MKFSRIGEHTIRCVISEEEILDMGYSLEDIMSNGARTQEFMNRIFDMAEQQFETNFEHGIKTVRADFMSDHTLTLTFSEQPGTEDMMNHLKDIVSGLLGGMAKDIPELAESAMEGGEKRTGDITEDETGSVHVLIVFDDMDVLIRYAGQVDVRVIPENALYKHKDRYYLLMDFETVQEEDLKRLSALTDEYACDLQAGAQRKAYIQEHGAVILEHDAIGTLRQL